MLGGAVHHLLLFQQTSREELLNSTPIVHMQYLCNILIRPHNDHCTFPWVNTVLLIRVSVPEIVVLIVNVRLVQILDPPFAGLRTERIRNLALFGILEAGSQDEYGLDDAIRVRRSGREALNNVLECRCKLCKSAFPILNVKSHIPSPTDPDVLSHRYRQRTQ